MAYDVYSISYDDNGEQVKEYWGEQTYVLKNTADGWRVDDWEDINW